MEKEVSDWKDDNFARGRFKAFNGHKQDWKEKVNFWRDLIIKISRHLDLVVIDTQLVVNKHLNILAKQHMETRFIKLSTEKSPFLIERLKIFMLPTSALVRNDKVAYYVVGFDELGGLDNFSTEELEDRLARSGVMTIDGEAKVL